MAKLDHLARFLIDDGALIYERYLAMAIEKRIENLEKVLEPAKRKPFIMVIRKNYANPDGTPITVPEPPEEWLTFKEQMARQSGSRFIRITLDPRKELEARSGTDASGTE